MLSILRRLMNDQRAATAMEYALVASAIALVAVNVLSDYFDRAS